MTVGTSRPDAAYVGRYQLLALIGEGGMGVVHLAKGPDGRRVALKVLRPHVVGDHEARERMAREVGSLSRIRSPRVAEILDADPHGPIPFVVTRYVPGLSLHHHVREHGVLGESDLVWLGAGLAEALSAVHRAGVLHRDVKPSNVLMEGRSPVLIDFGLARLAEDSRLTATGWLLGTPGYLAPEVLYGDDASAASDVHALAATLTFAAIGRAPYGTGPAMAILDRVRRGEHDLRGVPEGSRGLLAAALAPQPFDRPSLAELVQELGARRDRLATNTRLQTDTPADPIPTSAVPLTAPYVAGHRPPPTITPQTIMPQTITPQKTTPQKTTPPTTTPPTTTPPMVTPHRAPASSGPSRTRVLSTTTPLEPGRSAPAPWDADAAAPVRPVVGRSRAERTMAVGVGLVLTGLVALMPYLASALLIVLAALLRLVSVTAQRHQRRQQLRGRARWYDLPASALASPWYLLVSLVGTVVLALWSISVALALAVLLTMAAVPLVAGLGGCALGFVLALWWGPGGARVREFAYRTLAPLGSARSRATPTLAAGTVLAVVLLVVAAVAGPVWAPGHGAPWLHGSLAGLVGALHR